MAETTFKSRIRELRKGKYGTQESFAYRAGVSRATVQNWETGKHIPSLSEAARLADLFEVSIDYLAGRDAPAPGSTEEAEARALAAEAELEALEADPPSAPGSPPRSRSSRGPKPPP